MKTAKCRLCLQTKEIVKSHLIPRAIFERFKTGDLDPVMLTSEVVMPTSRQLQHPLLCSRCENRLNREGENWLLPLLARDDGRFSFYDILSEAPPVSEDRNLRIYATAENHRVKVGKLTHFAMGVFWKASIHSWSGTERNPLIQLGTYREPLRAFLNGEAPFPHKLALTVYTIPPPVRQIACCVPYMASRTEYRIYAFYVPGILFVLLVGNRVPREEGQACFVSNSLHPILVADFGEGLEILRGRIAAHAKISRRLTDHYKGRPAKE